MYKIAKITFEAAADEKTDAEGLKQKAEYILDALIDQGRIVGDFVLLWQESALSAIVSLPEEDAIDDDSVSGYAGKNAEGVSIRCEIIGDDARSTSPCSCQNPSWYLLDMGSDNVSSPLYCGDCGEEIPIYKIPYADRSGDHHRVISWQRVHQAVVCLWTESLSDRFSRRQIEDPASQLNREEMEIASELEKSLGKSVFLYLERPLNYPMRKSALLTCCPVCGKPLKKKTFAGGVYGATGVCKDCRICVNVPEERRDSSESET